MDNDCSSIFQRLKKLFSLFEIIFAYIKLIIDKDFIIQKYDGYVIIEVFWVIRYYLLVYLKIILH